MSKIAEVDIEPPHPDGSFTSLAEVAGVNSKGKTAVDHSRFSTGKRRREEDSALRRYDGASQRVASLLSGPTLAELDRADSNSSSASDGPPPAARRRIDLDKSISVTERTGSQESANSISSGDTSGGASVISTVATTPSPIPLPPPRLPAYGPSSSISKFPPRAQDESPFGYLNNPSNFPPAPPISAVQAQYNPHAMMHSWGSGSSGVVGSHPQFGTSIGVGASQAEAIHPHAYVTFGAGMRQKEIDTFTAKNKLEAHYISGSGDGIPYHVPL